jgi:hypothetical protein
MVFLSGRRGTGGGVKIIASAGERPEAGPSTGGGGHGGRERLAVFPRVRDEIRERLVTAIEED